MNTQYKPTYISLFSSAGVGCYGFKMAGFDCIATNELLERRLNIQRYNQKCKYPGGYICGDITQEQTKKLLYDQLELWKAKEHLSRVDVVIATPPCQGMSIANQKKTDTEIVRNSLVVESIKIIQKINPRFFVFENVPAFMKTICTDLDGTNKSIADAIERNLGQEYSYAARIINFKNYGACSSRQRTVVIGVSKDYADSISPLELYPDLLPERTLREVIGDMKPLKEFGEIDPTDIYHAFRIYPEHMRAWIADLKEGQSAFENPDDNKKPHQIINGEIVINKQKNHDKYKRQYWDKVGPCIHTRNDLLASQNTIHPSDDRVFSIREIMRMMTVPESFRWVDRDPDTLNQLPEKEKRAFLKKEETKIRQSLGEAVPTAIFHSIAEKIADALAHPPLPTLEINKIIAANRLSDAEALKEFLTENPLDLAFSTLSRIAELSNTNRTETAAFFTSKTLITEMMKTLPVSEQETVRILEPSVGVGNFIPFILKKFEGKNLQLDIVDIDSASLELAKILLHMLMYNRPNFRDIYADKPKGVTRKEYAATHPIEINEDYYRYQSNKATRFLRIFNDQTRNGQTEHLEPAHLLDKATHMHHIFPKSLYPEISFYLENIIALTPTQHLNYAHPNGRTQEINEQYQHLLLLSKADRIRENLSSANVEHIYEFSNLLFVLSTGFEEDTPLSIADMDFCAVVNAINRHYA